jgi:hypothetical protein
VPLANQTQASLVPCLEQSRTILGRDKGSPEPDLVLAGYIIQFSGSFRESMLLHIVANIPVAITIPIYMYIETIDINMYCNGFDYHTQHLQVNKYGDTPWLCWCFVTCSRKLDP